LAISKSLFGKRALKRARDDKSGVAALEFAIVAPLFLLLMMAIFELGAIYIADVTVQMVTTGIAREVRTGQIQTQNLSKDQFRTHYCSELPGFLSCDSSLMLDVEAFNNFGSAVYQPPLKPDGTMDPSLNNYNPGTSCQVVLVRAFYTWPVQTPGFLPFLVNVAGGKHLISAAAAFRNEPFTSAVSGC
jgi:Flp pilus assembly protein TadG